MELEVKTLSGSDAGKQAVGFDFVQENKGNQAVHDTVVAYLAAQRTGTAKTKDRGEVSGTGKKPWRQKGTGRARTGSRRTNIFTGGGVTHGPRPRDFSKKVNAKTRQLALRKALSERIKDGEVVLVDSLKLKTHKTKELRSHILSLKPENAETVLLVGNEQNDNLALAARNLPLLNLAQADTLNTYQVLWPDVVILSREALETVVARLNRK
ncbi:MAG: 50S ribosomal protein L4 [Verrucomicrobiota bacterium]|jgi:large subunit ribosomal protein L4|nr:50S ribosomal protein L4 [Verrucomicrobiota bacterium]